MIVELFTIACALFSISYHLCKMSINLETISKILMNLSDNEEEDD